MMMMMKFHALPNMALYSYIHGQTPLAHWFSFRRNAYHTALTPHFHTIIYCCYCCCGFSISPSTPSQSRYWVGWPRRQHQIVDSSSAQITLITLPVALTCRLCDVIITRCRCVVTSSVMTTRRKQSRPQRCCRHSRGQSIMS